MEFTRTLALQTIEQIGNTVMVSGWVNSYRDHGGLLFIDLRDHTGVVQLAVHPQNTEAFEVGQKLRDEFVIEATGIVKERAETVINENIPTGSIEIEITHLQILNTSKPLPFPIFDANKVNEDTRLKYRFLDLRREKMQRMLTHRSKFIKAIRDYMDNAGFVEITTPILTSSSPEGARDFLVPSRLHPGKFYALPQAPQQFKQLLMVGGLPKYFQIAPCFRDEDPRADRHPGEFYQLDLEMSFVKKPEDVFTAVEPMVIELTEKFAGKKVLQKPIPRISHDYALETYGSDKPDLRYDMKLV
ncbi:MAG TPA: amino acid--tRNA ligase-related protein, partial [Patescibacteria group bacterium]|nr:amino acid--tRNA ligase-related protein [Patescibacteria group bacterium]